MARYLRASDVISGQEGWASICIDGENHTLFYIKKLEAKYEKETEEIRVVGKRGVQNKAKGFKGTGTMVIYYATTMFRDMIAEYVETGLDRYFDITVSNNDPTSSIGKQTVLLRGCNINSGLLAKLDAENGALDEELSFTFDNVKITNQFADPS